MPQGIPSGCQFSAHPRRFTLLQNQDLGSSFRVEILYLIRSDTPRQYCQAAQVRHLFSLYLLYCGFQYNDYVHYIEPCFKGILVQADRDNREVSVHHSQSSPGGTGWGSVKILYSTLPATWPLARAKQVTLCIHVDGHSAIHRGGTRLPLTVHLLVNLILGPAF